MDPVLNAMLQSWNWRIDVIAVLLLLGTVYTTGWLRLRKRRSPGRIKRNPPRRLATGWRLAAYLVGLTAIGLALLSPIDVLAGQLFYMHMIQHLLLVMVAPPLLMIANPFPIFLWGLPLTARSKVAGLFGPKASFRRHLRTITPPSVAWIIFVAAFVGWHDPNAYNAALQSDLIHDLEHLTFFLTAMLYWWHVTQMGPRIHKRFPIAARIAFLLITVPVNMFLGIAITFSSEPIYTYYLGVPRIGGLTVIEDQMLGGLIMWIPGSMMFIVAALILIAGVVNAEEEKEPLPEEQWATDEGMIAPGWKK